MNLLIPAAAMAAALAAAAAFQDEDPDLNRPYQWVRADLGCTGVLNGPGEQRVGPITGLVETGMRDDVYLYFSASSEGWPLRQNETYALDVGFDGAAPRVHVAQAGSHQDGMLTFDVEPDFRARLRGARSIEFYRDGRRVGAVSAEGLAATMDAIEACAEADFARTPMVAASEMNAATDATVDLGPDGNYSTPEEMDAVLEAAASAVENAADAEAATGKPD